MGEGDMIQAFKDYWESIYRNNVLSDDEIETIIAFYRALKESEV